MSSGQTCPTVHHAMQVAHHFRRSPVIDSALDYQSRLTFGEFLVTLKVWKDLL
jgi:hypothetical protein